MTFSRIACAGFALALTAATGCGGGDERVVPAAQVDTTNADDLDGMSSEQVQAKAEALTPEEAAARGIAVDSTIHLGSPESDTVVLPAPTTDSAR